MASCAPATAAATYFPPELIPEVARRLTSLQDFFALRATCRAYRAALPLTPSNLASQAPLLLLVPGQDGQATESPALYHPSMRRLLRFRLPPPRRAQYSSSLFFSLGCRVVICDVLTDPNREEFRMVHLLTGEQTRLPSPEGAPFAFILSGDLLLTWSYDGSTIQSYRLGAADWSVTSFFWDYNLEGVVCVNGTIYVMVRDTCFESPVYRLAVVELSDDRRNSAEFVLLGALHTRAMELPVDTELLLYPAECHGELILIVTIEYNPRVYRAFKWKSGE